MSDAGITVSHATSDSYRSCAATHNGTVRDHNEDSFVNRPDLGLWAVADGAGGHQSGAVASACVADALNAIPAGLSAGQLLAEVRDRLEAAHVALRDEGDRRGSGAIIATTVVVVIARDDYFACLWAGDSRAYLLRRGVWSQVSRDHSLVQELVLAGAITEAEAERHPHANVITRAIGADADPPELEKRSDRLVRGDRFLLCSDGLCKCVPDGELKDLVAGHQGSEAQRLVLCALAKRANDNVTALVVEVLDPASATVTVAAAN